MEEGVDVDRDEELFYTYLDALLRGEEPDPEEFAAAHGLGTGPLPGWLNEVWGLVHGTPREMAGAPLERSTEVPFETVGAFRLLRPIGEGGMGRVYLARQEPLNRLCAVKLLRPEIAGSPTAAARMEREARVVAELSHDSILRVIEAGTYSGCPWIAFELVPGNNLDELLEDELPPIDQVVTWGCSAC